MNRFGEQESSVYADQFDIYAGNSNPDLARKICRYLGVELGRASSFSNDDALAASIDSKLKQRAFGRPTKRRSRSIF